jgi:hypothetical protein
VAYRIYKGLNAIFELKGPFAKLMTAERKGVIQASLRAGGELFKSKYIPLRFTDYAYRLGYKVTEAWKKFKRRTLKTGRAQPYVGTTPAGGGNVLSLAGGNHDGLTVYNPEKMSVAMARGCRVDISGTSRGGDIIIRTPFGHPLRTEYAKAFTHITEAENQTVAREVSRAFTALISKAVSIGGRSKKMSIPGASSSWKPPTFVARKNGTIKSRRNTDGITFR